MTSPRIKTCSWVCNGPNWAWRIQQYSHPGNAIYRLERASHTSSNGASVNYYEYMTSTYFTFIKNQDASFANNPQSPNYNFWRNWYEVGSYENWDTENDFCPFEIVPYDENYRDKDGYPFDPYSSDEILRVKKPLGNWTSTVEWDFVETPEIANPSWNCQFDEYYMSDFF